MIIVSINSNLIIYKYFHCQLSIAYSLPLFPSFYYVYVLPYQIDYIFATQIIKT